MSERRNPQLDLIARELRRLHLALVDVERRRYEREVREIGSAGDLLGLLTNDERFRWLGELSRLMVAIDELRDEPPGADAVALESVRAGIERLVTGGNGAAGDFHARYLAALQEAPEVAIAHAALRRLLRNPSDPADPGDELHDRHVRTMKHEHGEGQE